MNYFKVVSFIEDKPVSESILFSTKKEALDFKDTLGNKTQNILFNCSQEKEEEQTNKKVTFNDMELYRYVNGYLLVPNKNNVYYGMSKLNRGIWLNDMEGWYYSKCEHENLLNQGYTIKSRMKVDYKKYNLEDLEICFYKKGFLLIPNKSYRYYGQESLLGGVWDNTHNGWYFKKFKRYTSFVENGAKDLINNTFLE